MKRQAFPLRAGTRASPGVRGTVRETFAPWFSTLELSCPQGIHGHLLKASLNTCMTSSVSLTLERNPGLAWWAEDKPAVLRFEPEGKGSRSY